jgi:hypothetical protein
MELWENYREINEELKKQFLCIPPYQCVNGKFIGELNDALQEHDEETLFRQISGVIMSPFQRTYQIEYRFRHCDIFTPFLPVIEYATYDVMKGNWICAYLSLLPVTEASIYKWYEINPSISYSQIKNSGKHINIVKQSYELYQKQIIFDDDKKNITDGFVDYLKFVFEKVLYIGFDAYEKKKHVDTFNRNLSLHKLSGAVETSEVLRNLTRLLLVLDILAELYLMQSPDEYWHLIFNAVPEDNLDFQVRWTLYKNAVMQAAYSNDLSIIDKCFIHNTAANTFKEKVINDIELEEKLTQKIVAQNGATNSIK